MMTVVEKEKTVFLERSEGTVKNYPDHGEQEQVSANPGEFPDLSSGWHPPPR